MDRGAQRRLHSRHSAKRRQRRVVASATGIAASLALVVGGWALTRSDGGTRPIQPAGTGTTAPATAVALAGGLWSAMQDGALGPVGAPTAWRGTDSSPLEYAVKAEWGSAADHSTSTLDFMMVRRHTDALTFGANRTGSSRRFDPSLLCPSVHCQRSALPSGDTLFTLAKGGNVAGTSVVLDSPRRDLVLYANVEAGVDQGAWPPPSTDELAALIEQPWWAWRLPSSFQTAGAALQNYTEDRIPPTAPTNSVRPPGSGAASPGATLRKTG